MGTAPYSFTTGPTLLPAGDGINQPISVLSYNGCIFSPLFITNVSGVMVKDNAQRTVKLMEYTITADGYVTLPEGVNATTTIDPQMRQLYLLLSEQGGTLTYFGRGMDLSVGPAGRFEAGTKDVAWGPIPEVLDFQPLGAGRSAKVKWTVKTRIVQRPPKPRLDIKDLEGAGGGGVHGKPKAGGLAAIPALQFNYETTVSYGEDGYSSLSVNGTLEIPMTRSPTQKTKTLDTTVDALRSILDERIFAGISLAWFRITRREFKVSRDKRTMEFSYAAEERPYMDVPPMCTLASGTYHVRPIESGMGLALWLCTLRASYTVRGDSPRRTAWLHFLNLLQLRMSQSVKGSSNNLTDDKEPTITNEDIEKARHVIGINHGLLWNKLTEKKIVDEIKRQQRLRLKKPGRRAFLIDLNIEEGLYLNSKTTSFAATWRLVTTISHILLASGVWTKLAENDDKKLNLWATSMLDIMGSSSWLENKLDPAMDVIVDFGG